MTAKKRKPKFVGISVADYNFHYSRYDLRSRIIWKIVSPIVAMIFFAYISSGL